MLRLGIIGCGRVTKMFHLNAIEDASNVTVVALADTLKNRVAETMKSSKVDYGCTDYQDLLNNSFVDAVVINTPPSYHEEIVLDALQARKHVICEKPLAQTILGCDPDARSFDDLADRPIFLFVRFKQVAYGIYPTRVHGC